MGDLATGEVLFYIPTFISLKKQANNITGSDKICNVQSGVKKIFTKD